MPTLQDDKQDSQADKLDPAVRSEQELLARQFGANSTPNENDSTTTEDSSQMGGPQLPAKNKDDQDLGSKSLTPAQIKDSEEDVAQNTDSSRDTVGRGFTGTGKKKTNLRVRFNKHKLPIMFLGAPVGLGMILVVLLLVLVSSLKIPNLAQNIEAYQFSRITRQFSETAENVTGEELAVEATTNAEDKSGLLAKFANAKGKVSETWSKLDKYRPNKVIAQKLGGESGLRLNFTGDQFTGATLNGTEIPLSASASKGRYVPGVRSLLGFKSDVQFSSDFAPALEQALADNKVGPIMRGIVANRLRRQIGIGLVAWSVGKYQGKKLSDAEVQQVQEQAERINGGNPTAATGVVDETNAAEEEAVSAETEALGTKAGVEDILKNGGFATSVKNAIGKTLAKTPIQEVTSFLNPTAAAVPICIVYDGSLNKSGPLIDQSVDQQQSAFFYTASAADQLKTGSTSNDPDGSGLALAANATDTNIRDITQSNAQLRASGDPVNTADGTTSAEASATGEYTLLNALGLPSAIASTVNEVGDNVCPTLTNVWVQGSLALANILVQFIPGVDVGADSAEAAVDTAGDAVTNIVVKKEATSLSQRVLGNILNKTTSGKLGASTVSKGVALKNMVLDGVKSTTKIVGITIFAKLLVASRSGQLNSATAESTDFANEADSGANIQQGELERTQLFGRPLLKQEVCQSNADDTAFNSQVESQKSAYDRYFALSDANSMLSKSAMALSTSFGGSFPKIITRVSNYLTQPLGFFGSIENLFMGRAVAAVDNCADDSTSDYGNVQFGWSDDEESLINGSDSYLPLENQAILDGASNGGEDAIASKYAPCFGYTYNSGGDGSLDPTDPNGDLTPANGPGDSGSLGTLLSDGNSILRDAEGNVLDQGLCSQSNLSYNNNDFGPGMVFRWRLAMRYDTTMDQLISEQTDSNTGDAGATP